MSRRRAFVVAYACSGAAALVYEVAWTRLLTLRMGHTVSATSIVLGAFMGGLALGGWLGGGRAAPTLPSRRLRTYAGLEVFIAGFALALPSLLTLADPALVWAYSDATAPWWFTATRLSVGLLLVGVPAVAMGATFPLAAAWFVESSGATTAAGAGSLYVANTAGAAVGALGAGFWIIPAAGIRAAIVIGAALNAIAAVTAVWLGAREDPGTVHPSPPDVKPQPIRATGAGAQRRRSSASESDAPRRGLAALGCGAAALSGFAALVDEVVWTRLIAVIVGPTTYAFATMVAAFVAGLALGSAAGVRLVRRARQPLVWLGAMLIGSGVAANVSGWLAASRMPQLMASAVAARSQAFDALLLYQAFVVAVLLLPMTLALGATFPLTLAVASHRTSTAGRDAARVYSSNSLGAIAGALVGGFVLVPNLGLRQTLQIVAIGCVLAGAVCLHLNTMARGRRLPATLAPAVAVAATTLIVLLPQWNRLLLSSGGYLYGAYVARDDLDVLFNAGRLDYYKEGAAGTVTVRSLAGRRSLVIDGKVDASTGSDMPTQQLLGLLPVLMHRSPDEAAIIGLGSGVTVSAAVAPGTVKRADVIEISPEVVEAARWFARENRNVTSAPGVRVIVGDGRSHVALTSRRYDVIISEPPNPWIAGVAALFTREFFQSVQTHLKPGGLFCQWAHTYDIGSSDLRSIVRTYLSVFPKSTLWLVGDGDLLMIGSTDVEVADQLDVLAQQATAAGAQRVLAGMGVPSNAAAFALLSLFAGGPAEFERFGAGASIQTDDRMALEFSAPRDLHGQRSNENAILFRELTASAVKPTVVRTAIDSATDVGWFARGQLELDAEAYPQAYDALQRAAVLNSRNPSTFERLTVAALGSRRQTAHREWLEGRAAAEPNNDVLRVALARELMAARKFTEAEAVADEAARINPQSVAALEQLALVLAAAGRLERLTAVAQTLSARFPTQPETYHVQALDLLLHNRVPAGVEVLQRLLAGDPRNARAQKLLGSACASLDQKDCARRAFEAALAVDWRDATVYVNLGSLEMRASNPGRAADYFLEALSVDRSSDVARKGLAQARAALSAIRQ